MGREYDSCVCFSRVFYLLLFTLKFCSIVTCVYTLAIVITEIRLGEI